MAAAMVAARVTAMAAVTVAATAIAEPRATATVATPAAAMATAMLVVVTAAARVAAPIPMVTPAAARVDLVSRTAATAGSMAQTTRDARTCSAITDSRISDLRVNRATDPD